MDFGFTNDKNRLLVVQQWKALAIADGWEAKPTYPKYESIDSASTLNHSDGFVCMILTRDNKDNRKWGYEVTIHLWGRDKLAINPPNFYSMEKIIEGEKKCNYCKKIVDQTYKVGFAGRACIDCKDKEEEKLGPNFYC